MEKILDFKGFKKNIPIAVLAFVAVLGYVIFIDKPALATEKIKNFSAIGTVSTISSSSLSLANVTASDPSYTSSTTESFSMASLEVVENKHYTPLQITDIHSGDLVIIQGDEVNDQVVIHRLISMSSDEVATTTTNIATTTDTATTTSTTTTDVVTSTSTTTTDVATSTSTTTVDVGTSTDPISSDQSTSTEEVSTSTSPTGDFSTTTPDVSSGPVSTSTMTNNAVDTTSSSTATSDM